MGLHLIHPDFCKWLFIITLLGLLTACSSEPPTQSNISNNTITDNSPAFGDRLITASIGDASTLIPMIAGDSASHEIAGWLYQPLLKFDKNLNISGQLAQSWDISSDGLSITFHLRPNITWSDGKPFTSADCAFTLALIQDEHTQSAYKSDYAKVTAFDTPDKHTFVVHYAEVYSPALSTWAGLAIMPKHVFENEDIMDTDLARHPKATLGAYVLKDWQSQQSITLQANPNYYAGKVWIAERMTRIIPDSATQFLELTAGNIDEMALTPTQYSRLFERTPALKKHYDRYKYLQSVYTYLGFNLKRPLFQDQRIREAIAYAIDRQELIDGVLLGHGEIIASPYKPGTVWVNQSLKPRPFDPNKAKKLLAKAGWVDSDTDGYLDKDGKILSFTIITNNGNKQRADTATIIQQRLKQIGIKVNVRLIEWSAFIENFINKRQFDAVILGWSLTPEPDQYNIWHSSQTGERQFNFLSYNNAKVDEALIEATRTFDQKKRKQWYDIMQQEIYSDVPMVFLYAPYSLPAIHKRIQGIKPAPAGIGYNSEFWYVPKALQKYQVTSMQP
ncbi:MAG: peptide-binding protein [Mariprofundaceae bacterium]|nr:peptide-binding protein [Mariprofundaceae bacterium]